ncbi:hypothetical protein ACFLWL_01080 [Chloroflexota bacterium]
MRCSFSKVVSYGNALDVDESELLDYLSPDPETEFISAYIEGVKDGRRFLSALKTTTARKPVAIYKGGMTEVGKRAAYGHMASLTSSVAVFAIPCHLPAVICHQVLLSLNLYRSHYLVAMPGIWC